MNEAAFISHSKDSHHFEEINKSETEPLSYFEPITAEDLSKRVKALSEQIGIDYSNLPIDIARPGSPLFDSFEAQTRLQQVIPWDQLHPTLESRGINLAERNSATALALRQLAREAGITLDGTMPGFVYNIGGSRVIYFAIHPDSILPMAQKYAQKEGVDPESLTTIEQAQKFLETLAVKYLYHELGHTTYRFVLDENEQAGWSKTVDQFPDLYEKVIEVQLDKYPSPEHILVAEEAFADLFSEVVTNGEIENRLGKHDEAQRVLKNLLINKGFTLNQE